MADVIAPPVSPIESVQTRTSGATLSLSSYQSWMATNGLLPVDRILLQHPSNIASTASHRVKDLSDRWNGMLDSTADLFSKGSADATVSALEKDVHPGPARSAMTGERPPMAAIAADGVSENQEPLSAAQQAAEQAALAIRETTAQAIRQQWQQTVAIIEHGLSRQIITAAIQSSISASKEVNEGLDTLLRS